MKNVLLEQIMNIKVYKNLTICGAARYRDLMEKYQAFYTLKNNIVSMPINYESIRKEVETTNNADTIKEMISYVQNKKIARSEGVIIVTGQDYYMDEATIKELIHAYSLSKPVLFTNIPDDEKDKYYFNNNKTYPLYILKEEYK